LAVDKKANSVEKLMTSSGENVQLVAKHEEGVAIMQCGRKMKPGNISIACTALLRYSV